jgi:hypothetical protein
MVALSIGIGNWRRALGQWLQPTPAARAVVPLRRPALDVLAQPSYGLPSFVQNCPVAQKYLSLLGPLPWSVFPERPSDRPWPGPAPQPRAPFVAAFLVQVVEQKPSHGALRTFLVEHPALVWLLGFPLVADKNAPHGFDVQASVPDRRRLGRVLRELSDGALQWLLDQTVDLIRTSLPAEVAAGFGQTVSGDTKHILAWVRENNPKAFVKEGRYDKTRQPKGDRDCKLGVKSRANRSPSAAEDAADHTTPASEPVPASALPVGAECYWGYASGVMVTQLPGYGEVVLAEHTDTFDKADVSYFQPLMAATTRRLGCHPTHGAFDAAFDAWYVHQPFYEAGGFAAVPFVQKGKATTRSFDSAGRLLCAAGLVMPRLMTFADRTTSLVPQTRGKWGCPLVQPAVSGACCPINHPRWPSGGCTTTMGTSDGARLRYTLDRQSASYKEVYRQRTATERINSQATALGIERPRLRNRLSISHRNTLIYVLLNLRTLQRIRAQAATRALAS